MNHSTAAGLMIGRGAIRNPWIFSQLIAAMEDGECSHPTHRDLLAYVLELYDELAGAKNLLDAGKITVSEGRTYARAVKVFAKASLSCATASATLSKASEGGIPGRASALPIIPASTSPVPAVANLALPLAFTSGVASGAVITVPEPLRTTVQPHRSASDAAAAWPCSGVSRGGAPCA